MGEILPLTDLGPELWVLVHHLYKKYKLRPAAAFCELALRTRCECRSEDVCMARSPSLLVGTQWYREMTERYRNLRQGLKKTQQDAVREAEDVTRSLYTSGCRVREYVDALQTCAAMLTRSIPSHVLLRFAPYRVEELASRGCVQITVDELVNDLIERPLLDAMTPPQWWRCDTEQVSAAVSVKKVGLRARPAQIDIVCSWSGRLRCYRIHLDGVLSGSGPTAPLARRLARTHGTLLSEEQFRAYLVRLQGLVRSAAGGEEGRDALDATPTTDRHAQRPPAAGADISGAVETKKKPSSVGNKADVGLLYRDPEAALDNVDLNDADDITLQEFKAKMEEKFLENVLRPGDPGYQYDKRLEVRPTERSEWDDSD